LYNSSFFAWFHFQDELPDSDEDESGQSATERKTVVLKRQEKLLKALPSAWKPTSRETKCEFLSFTISGKNTRKLIFICLFSHCKDITEIALQAGVLNNENSVTLIFMVVSPEFARPVEQ